MLEAVQRANIIHSETLGPEKFGIIQKPLTLAEKIYNQTWLRKVFIIVVLAAGWQLYGLWLDNPLLVPTFSDTVRALVADVANGTIPDRALSSIEVLLVGFATGTVLAGLLTVFAISTQIGTDFLETMTAMFNPLPAIALLPLALIWFGLGAGSLVFVLVHSVMWAVALNTLAGFRSVSTTVRMVRATHDLRRLRFVAKILSGPRTSILAGLKSISVHLAHADRRHSCRRVVGEAASAGPLRKRESLNIRKSAPPTRDHRHQPCSRERHIPLHRNQNSPRWGSRPDSDQADVTKDISDPDDVLNNSTPSSRWN